MYDLQEIRRFWPWMRPADWFGDKRAFWARTVRGVQVTVGEQDDAWGVSFFDDRRRRPSNNNPRNGNQFFTGPCHYGPNIAAAMAAAGFGRRLPGIRAIWRRGDAPAIKLESRQLPRKGVRLGKRGRRLALAASIGDALDLVRQKRLDRGEVGNG